MTPDSPAPESPVKRALVEIRRLKRELEAARRGAGEGLAVIGVGFRFPGVTSDPDLLHDALAGGADGIREIPADRWDVDRFFDPEPGTPGRMYVDRGGFLDDVRGFDPEFFGITPLEASSIDPQQRLLLEVAWEALEHACVSPARLKGSRTGVFLGMAATDYARLAFSSPEAIGQYASVGTALSVAAGRLSYLMDLNGPAVTVDTACSSSLVAVHLACDSLRRRETDMAVVGGVNLILSPDVTINFCQANMLSPDGRCKTFDASADGYVRSEGCGVVLLKRLSDARAAGDRVLAVVRGSALNQDGRSSGITAPNGPAQEAVIRDALADAGLEPTDIGYVEAHGTGTSLGDPIEMQALGAVHRGRPRGEPLWVGSVKSNFGHLEAAAGIAGLIKAVAALRSGEIPPSLHFDDPNPLIPWRELPLAVPTGPVPFPETGGRRRAGVSSFGFSGTNAHVVVEEAPAAEEPAPPGQGPRLVTLSAVRAEALEALAGEVERRLSDGGADLADVAYSANTGRAAFPHRLAVVAESAAEAAARMAAWGEDRAADGTFAGQAAPGRSPTAAFAFAGAVDPESCARMARWLWRFSPAARPVLEAGDAIVRRETGASPVEAWGCGGSGAPPAASDEALTAWRVTVEVAVSHTWRAWGLTPDLLVFAGAGTLSAAVDAGALSLEDGVTAALEVDRLGAASDEVAARLEEAVAGRASPDEELTLVSAAGATPFGGGAGAPSASLWLDALRDGGGMGSLAGTATREGADWIVSATPTAAGAAEAPPDDVAAPVIGLGSPAGADTGLLAPLGRLFALGFDPRWDRVHDGMPGRKVTLPSYPFQRRDFWLEGVPAPGSRPPASTSRPGPDPWEAAVAAGADKASWAPIDLDLGSYEEKWALLRELNEAVGRDTLVALGGVTTEEARTPGEVRDAAGIEATYQPIVRRWLEGMERRGTVAREGNGLRLRASADEVDTAGIWSRVEAAMADNAPLLAYVRHCVELLEGVLVGRTSPLETLFPDGRFDLARALYEESTGQRYVNGIAASVLSAWSGALPEERTVRVLEVGAGTGGTTSSLLPALGGRRARYLFTDVSDVFLAAAEERFAHVPFLETRLYDLEAPPEAQGIEEGAFDVVVGSNVLHAVKHLPDGLERIRSVLAPGGVLLLVESTGHLDWHDLTTGLIEGWQHFEDDLRQDGPLLSLPAWRDVLGGAGFAAVEAFPGEASPAAVLRQSVIVARAPGKVSSTAPAAAREGGSGVREPAGAAPGAETGLAVRLRDAIGPEREEVVVEAVRACVMEVLRWDPSRPPSADARLMELGVDSLMAVRLRNRIQESLGVEALSATLVFDHPTIGHIARLLLARHDGSPGGAEEEGGGAPEGVPAVPDGREEELASMSDDEAEALLMRRLEEEEAR